MAERPFTGDSFYAYLKEEGKLMGVRCKSCGLLSVEPRSICRGCKSRDVEWAEFSGKGKLSTFTCISVAPNRMIDKGYGRDNPYCSGIVTLEEGPRIGGVIRGVDASNPGSIKTGSDVMLDLEDMDPETPGLAFRPA